MKKGFLLLAFILISIPSIALIGPKQLRINRGIDSTDWKILFISKEQIKKNRISSIKNYIIPCLREDEKSNTRRCYIIYKFNAGRLISESSLDGLKTSIQEADELSYKYYYKKGKNETNYLDFRTGDAYNGLSHEDHLLTYKYFNGRLDVEIYKTGIFSKINLINTGTKVPETLHSDLTKYFYDNKGQLISSQTTGNGMQMTSKYFLYSSGKLIAIFPAKEPSMLGDAPADTIYNYVNLKRIKKMGFTNFKLSFLNGATLVKIVDDCYTAVKSDELLVNGETITSFLSKISLNKTQYDKLVFEIADNYFLFYKIVH